MHFRGGEHARVVTVSTATFKLRVRKATFGLELSRADGAGLLRTTEKGGVVVGDGTTLTADDHFFGIGYMRECRDARGHTLTWTCTHRHNEATAPFFMNPRGYAFLSNNTWKNDFDFTGPDTFTVTTVAGELDCFLMVGSDFCRLLDLYTDLTGKPQMAPKWALGLIPRALLFFRQALIVSGGGEQRRGRVGALDG